LVAEVNVNDKEALALPAEWVSNPGSVDTGSWPSFDKNDSDGGIYQPITCSNADAQLLYQLDTASMPPLVRQVFDRHDFKTSLFGALIEGMKQWMSQTEVVSGYVFEPQRKATMDIFKCECAARGKKACGDFDGSSCLHVAGTVVSVG